MRPEKLLLFCGPSGSGKTTIVQHLLKSDKRFAFSVSATTRVKRENETDGIDYHFLSPEEFRRLILQDAFIEWEEVYPGRYYGTLRSEVDKIWKSGKVPLFDVDVEGGVKIKEKFGKNLLAVFVQPPSVEALHQRLTARKSETAESFKTRTEKSEHELSYANRFDKIIINDTLELALSEAQKIVEKFLGP